MYLFDVKPLGMALGWAWGAAAVAAAFQARDKKLLASNVQRAQAGLASATRPDLAYQEQIFRGAFLCVHLRPVLLGSDHATLGMPGQAPSLGSSLVSVHSSSA